LAEDPAGLLDLPRGFRYRIIQQEGDHLAGGGMVPGDFDGMAAFAGPKPDSTVLVRNHELSGDSEPVPGDMPYDAWRRVARSPW